MDSAKNQPQAPGPRSEEHVFYDGECGVCHWSVGFVARRDPEGRAFRFAPIGGDTFKAQLDDATRADLPDSILVRTLDGRLLMKSQGLIYILRRIGSFWSLPAFLIWLVPRPLRDFGYDLFARYRKRWTAPPAGVCPVLPPEMRGRFDP